MDFQRRLRRRWLSDRTALCLLVPRGSTTRILGSPQRSKQMVSSYRSCLTSCMSVLPRWLGLEALVRHRLRIVVAIALLRLGITAARAYAYAAHLTGLASSTSILVVAPASLLPATARHRATSVWRTLFCLLLSQRRRRDVSKTEFTERKHHGKCRIAPRSDFCT